jgi:hypothetical protein
MLYLIGSPPLSGMTIDIGARRLEGHTGALRSLPPLATMATMEVFHVEHE